MIDRITAVGAALTLTLAVAACSDDDASEEADQTTTTTEAETTTTTEPTTTTTEPPPEPVVYEGSGDSVIDIELPDPDLVAAATIGHSGERNFAIWELDEGLVQLDLAVNTIGSYEGTVLLNKDPSALTNSLEITADGAWTVEVKSVELVRQWDDGVEGTGDDVVLVTTSPQTVALHHSGERNFAIWFHDGLGGGSDLLVNDIGSFDGTVPLRSPTGDGAVMGVLEITADGPWSVTPA
jgi:hypothetical protein